MMVSWRRREGGRGIEIKAHYCVELCHLNVTLIHLFIIAVSIGLAVTYAWTQHWVIGNLYAICIAIQAIRCLTLDSFGTGYLLLLGMLAYDMFWVFGTDTMEYLSKVLVYAPTSVVWPRNINTYVHNTLLKSDLYFTMFGLGEIIVPGNVERRHWVLGK